MAAALPERFEGTAAVDGVCSTVARGPVEVGILEMLDVAATVQFLLIGGGVTNPRIRASGLVPIATHRADDGEAWRAFGGRAEGLDARCRLLRGCIGGGFLHGGGCGVAWCGCRFARRRGRGFVRGRRGLEWRVGVVFTESLHAGSLIGRGFLNRGFRGGRFRGGRRGGLGRREGRFVGWIGGRSLHGERGEGDAGGEKSSRDASAGKRGKGIHGNLT